MLNYVLMMSNKAKKPLVAILGSRDYSVEMPILKDVAEVAFCNVGYARDLHQEVLNEAFAVLLWYSIRLTEDDLKKFITLRLIVRIGTGCDNVDTIAAGKLGIAVCYVPRYDVEETADSTMSLILNLYRRTFCLANTVKEGIQFDKPDKVGEYIQGCSRIRDSTLGIVGLQEVGLAVALRAKEFGFKILFYDPCVLEGFEKSFGFRRMYTLKDLLNSSHCVSLHCDLNPSYFYGVINRNTIMEMRCGAYLVNTSQSCLIDEYDLAFALKNGQIGAAALDVHDFEPHNVLEGPLKDAPNLICTPHVAWFSDDSYRELREMAAHEIRRAITGRIPDSLRICVNKTYLIGPDENITID